MESSAVKKTEETVKKLNDICNMSWLKHNSQSSEEFKHIMESKVIMPETPNMQDFVAGSMSVKKRKSKKSKSKAAVSNADTFKDTKADVSNADTSKDTQADVSNANTSKDTKADVSNADTFKNTNSKHLDTDTENSKKQGEETLKLIASSKITVTSSTVWNANSNAATALFPETQSASVQIIDEDIELEKVLKNSVLTAELEQFRLNDESKVNWADDLEDPRWNSDHQQLETSCDKDKDTEKVEKKSHDDNNNSDNKSVNCKEDPKKLDNYRRDRSYRDQQNFTGRETHTKEQQMFGHESSTGFFNQRQSTSLSEKSVCDYSQKINPYDNKNRGQRDYVDSRCNDDRREYRNRNFQTFNQRGRFDNQNQCHRFDNHPQRHDNYPQRHDNCPQRHDNYPQRHDNQHQTYNNQQQKNGVHQQYNNQPYRYDNQCQRYDNQQRRFENNRYGNNQRRDFPNRGQQQYSNSYKEELKDRVSTEFQHIKENSNHESNKNTTPEIQQTLKKEKEEEPERKLEFSICEPEVTPDIELEKEDIKEVCHLNMSTTEDSPSFTIMQESINENESCENAVENNDPKSETVSEQSEYLDTQTVAANPFIIRQVPIQVIHPSGIMYQTPEGVSIHNEIFAPQNMSTFNKQSGPITYNVISNPITGPVLNPQHFHHQHTLEILPESVCTAVPMQNFDMRLYHQSHFVHNHPLMPMTLPMGMSPCGHFQQMPMGNLPGMNFVHQHPVNCQHCQSNFCQSQRIPIQHLNCQSPIYPQFTNVMSSMGSVLIPITPANQEQIIPQLGQNPHYAKISQVDKMDDTPATVIEKSANNLVNLCENLPCRRGSYPTNCPPGFENNDSVETTCTIQKKIICDKERDILPSFRNIPKEYAEENSGRISKTTEEFSDEKLADIYDTIFDTTKSENLEKEEVRVSFKWPESFMKFSKDSCQEQLLKSHLNSEENSTKSKDIQAPKPGIRFGIGRGKKISRAD